MNARQEKFCERYALTGNGRQSAIAAGYSERTADQQASRLLNNVKVKTKIAKLREEGAERARISLDDVLRELKTLAFQDIGNFLDWDGNSVMIRRKERLSEEQRKCIESISEVATKDGTAFRLKLHSKLRALAALVKLFEVIELKERVEDLERRITGGDL